MRTSQDASVICPRSEIEEYAIQPYQSHVLLFLLTELARFLFYIWRLSKSARVSLLHVLLPSLVLVSLARLLPQNVGIFEHFPNLDFLIET